MSDAFAPPFEFEPAALREAVSGSLDGEVGTSPWRITTDSRQAGPGILFVALKGDRFDGHDFVPGLLARPGAGVLVAADHPVARTPLPDGALRVVVADTLTALGELARWVRRSVEVPVVGLTGSSGKTTTKEMVAALLSRTGPGLATEGNLNNLVGLPLTLLRLKPEHRWMVLEMGMSASGEIRSLAGIGEPTIRVITNVAAAHLESFGDLDAVARAKGEMFEDARPGDLLITNADDPRSSLFPRPADTREVRFGASPGADVRVLRVEPLDLAGSRARIDVHGIEVQVHVPLPGRHNVLNACAALAAAWAVGVPLDEAAAALAEIRPTGGRMRVLRVGSIQVIDDSYNANPRSVTAALETLVSGDAVGACRAVLGDMLELGVTSPDLHRQVGETAASLGVDQLLAVGPLSQHTIEGALEGGMKDARHLADADAVVDLLTSELRSGDRVLVKGSRGMRMERVVKGLKESMAC
jgi:UDP-N-acetylmuramoyl-tripeptide--D-alanyl-D-alanine ligase